MAEMKNNLGNCCHTSIDCEAHNCKYNHNLHCAAEHIDIKGSEANTSRETLCATFTEEGKNK